MDATSLRVWTRIATATKQINAIHSQMLQTLLSLHNLKQQLTASVALSKTPNELFNSTSIDNNVISLLIKTQLRKSQMLLNLLQNDQMDKLEQAVIQLQTIRREVVSLVASSPQDQGLVSTAVNVDSLAGMYDAEVRVLRVLVSEVKLGSGYSVIEDDDDDEKSSAGDAYITIEGLIERWKTLREVDLVFEGQLMEIARNAAEANSAI
ncbi:hypothetical protein BDR26DRAFT_851471, partial [Obelidium mucronatum]